MAKGEGMRKDRAAMKRRERRKLMVDGYKKQNRTPEWWAACRKRLVKTREGIKSMRDATDEAKKLSMSLIDDSIWAIDQM